ncbi:MAG: pro-sigmaK processing inhibitor BofA family protein [Erysipelotrichales bacterium]|nr:pro-sigmaK processing inhibitor BofA family protein [Erysipelotrichales bacterium]
MIKEIAKSLIIGVVALYLINFFGSRFFDYNIPVNVWTILLVGFLRVPGLVVVIIILLL